jgi:hypothetical protein
LNFNDFPIFARAFHYLPFGEFIGAVNDGLELGRRCSWMSLLLSSHRMSETSNRTKESSSMDQEEITSRVKALYF